MVQTAAAKNRRRSAIIGDKKSSLFWHMMMIHTQLKLSTTSSRTTQPKFYDHQGTHHQKLIQSATIGQLVHWCEFRKSNTTLRVQQCHFEITRKTADLRTNTIMSLETPENDLRTRDQTRWAYQRNFNRPMSILLPYILTLHRHEPAAHMQLYQHNTFETNATTNIDLRSSYRFNSAQILRRHQTTNNKTPQTLDNRINPSDTVTTSNVSTKNSCLVLILPNLFQ